jgi:trk system potassium uptake protein TrkA
MVQQFAIIGLGRFGTRLAKTLAAAGAEVIGIDRRSEPVSAIQNDVTLAVRLDATDIEALRVQGVQNVDTVVIGIGEDFEATLLTLTALKELGAAQVVARAQSHRQAVILQKIGADDIVQPEHESAIRWSHRLMIDSLTQYIELGEHHAMVHMNAPKTTHEKTLEELNLRQTTGLSLVAIERATNSNNESPQKGGLPRIHIVPEPKTKILTDDILVLVGSNDALKAFRDNAQ